MNDAFDNAHDDKAILAKLAHQGFPKIARLQRDIVITEKIDGTNAQVFILDLEVGAPADAPLATFARYGVWAGSRNRWLQPGKEDNFGFAAWVLANAEALAKGLGPGRHYGEWWGAGIQRRYALDHKRFSLFNVSRWAAAHFGNDPALLRDKQQYAPACCHVVPVLYSGPFTASAWEGALGQLRALGSVAAPGFMNPEGIVVFHTASSTFYKQTLVDDACAFTEGRRP
jgi:hypothetical protein